MMRAHQISLVTIETEILGSECTSLLGFILFIPVNHVCIT